MLFDEDNIYFDDYKNINIENVNINRSKTLYSYEEGFNKGNLFKDLYSKYKNHVYKLNVSNDKDKLLLDIQTHTFALKDLNLYLDTHPEDQSILEEFNKIKNKLDDLKNKYENKYGPLCLNSVNSNKDFTWINNPWPWDIRR
jgi:spore coat protein JB